MMILHYHSLSLFSLAVVVVVVVVVLPSSSSSSFAFLDDGGGIGFGGTIIGFGGVVFLELYNRRRQLSRQRVLAAAAARHISTMIKVGACV